MAGSDSVRSRRERGRSGAAPGFYEAALSEAERVRLPRARRVQGLDAEIALLRVAGLERALAEARALAEERGQAVAALTERATLATAKYRQAALAATPEVPPELVQGATVEEVDAAMSRAKALVDEVRKRAAARPDRSGPRTPAGAPARSAPDLSGLTAREKIAHGLARRG